jgi:hypothetical protein
MENTCKLKALNDGMEPDGLMEADESVCKGIRVINYVVATGISQGRPKYRWEDNIKQDICQLKIQNWIACVQDRGKWKEVIEKAKTFN